MNETAASLIKRALPISQYVARFSDSLKAQGGGRFKSTCIAHGGDNSTAMSVDDNKGLWFCHSSECGGGSIIDLWMRMNNSKDFGEAVTQLGKDLNVTLPEYNAGGHVSQRRIISALKAVQREAQDFLLEDDHPDAETTRAYLKSRGVKRSVIKEWGIGCLPSGREATSLILEVCDDEEALIEAGVLNRNSDGKGLWASMNGRLHFPIRDESGSVVAFGARIVDGVDHSMAGKFVNTHETSVYHKSRILYGENLFQKTTKNVIVVEGYLDTIAVNSIYDGTDTVAVAACGTSLTDGHIKVLDRFDSVTYIFDGDEAGRKASIKALRSANTLRDRAKVVSLGDAQDPWDMFIEGDSDDLVALVDDATEMCDQIVQAKWHLVDGDEASLVEWLRDVIPTLSYSHHRDKMIQVCSATVGKSVSSLKRELAVPVDIASRRVRDADIDSMSQPGRSMCQSILSMDDNLRQGIFACLHPWGPESEEMVQKWLPLSNDMDIMVFRKIILGSSDITSEGSVDTTVAEMMGNIVRGDESGDLSFLLRGLAKQALAEISSLKLSGPLASSQVKLIRSAGPASKIKENQANAFSFLMDAAMDIDMKIEDRARASA